MNPGSSALEADALTTRPTRRYYRQVSLLSDPPARPAGTLSNQQKQIFHISKTFAHVECRAGTNKRRPATAILLSARDDFAKLGQTHTRSAPSLSSVPKAALETVPVFISLTSEGWNVGRFLSPLLFPSGHQCCDALACPCSESSSSFKAPLPCQAADQGPVSWRPTARQVKTVFTVQPPFHHRHSTNRVSCSVTIVGERAVTPHLVVHRR